MVITVNQLILSLLKEKQNELHSRRLQKYKDAHMKEVLSLKLRASNSSGVQLLSFHKQDDAVYPCLHGEFNGERIQIDFDELDERGISDLIFILKRMIEK